jgi:hypothetical protein
MFNTQYVKIEPLLYHTTSATGSDFPRIPGYNGLFWSD